MDRDEKSYKMHNENNWKKSALIISIFVFAAIALFSGFLYKRVSPNVVDAAEYESNVEKVYNQALVNTYLSDIQAAVDLHYADYYTTAPVVAYYVIEVKDICSDQKENSSIYIKFHVMPYIGAHNTVGEDEITFMASYTGDVKLENYNHIKDYELPEHLKSLKK